ncbi:MAG: alanine--glyoxylate aminotransferase family protein [Nitrospirae bacterium]|nr:alanine--glyoxylate aminotransferase family protein [Nitrospirota bacterium]
MKREYLFAPGPTQLPEEILRILSEPIVYHRGPKFKAILQEARADLKVLFQTEQDVLVLTSSGTGAMEAAVTHTLSRGDRALVIEGGKFGERWGEICQAYGVDVEWLRVPWGKAVDPADVRKALTNGSDIRAVFVQASETSTGVKQPVHEIAEITRRLPDTLLAVDGITAVGVFPVPMDAWGIDVMVSGSQKAMMLPPGLGFIAMGPRAWARAERSDLPKFYFNLRKERELQPKGETNFTPAVPFIVALRRALQMIREEGLEQVFARHERLAKATREGMRALGLELFAPESPSNACTAVKVPAGVDGEKIPKHIRETYGVTIAGGQSKLKGKIFRIAHLGYYNPFDMVMVMSAVEMTLRDLGYPAQIGAGVRKVQEILAG